MKLAHARSVRRPGFQQLRLQIAIKCGLPRCGGRYYVRPMGNVRFNLNETFRTVASEVRERCGVKITDSIASRLKLAPSTYEYKKDSDAVRTFEMLPIHDAGRDTSLQFRISGNPTDTTPPLIHRSLSPQRVSLTVPPERRRPAHTSDSKITDRDWLERPQPIIRSHVRGCSIPRSASSFDRPLELKAIDED
jgi:hypothetical protein